MSFGSGGKGGKQRRHDTGPRLPGIELLRPFESPARADPSKPGLQPVTIGKLQFGVVDSGHFEDRWVHLRVDGELLPNIDEVTIVRGT